MICYLFVFEQIIIKVLGDKLLSGSFIDEDLDDSGDGG